MRDTIPNTQDPRLGLSLFDDFEHQFSVIYAGTEELKREAYAIRHHVLNKDLGIEQPKKYGMDIDCYDAYSHHLLLKHRTSDRYAGTIRLITPQITRQKLPIQDEGVQEQWASSYDLDSLLFNTFSEVSKLAVTSEFHQRKSDQHPLSETLRPNTKQNLSPSATRDFPKITMGLYLAAIALARQLFHDHVFAVMPPMLFKKLRGYGLLFDTASRVFENAGPKAVYHLNMEQGVRIAPTIYGLNDTISNQLASQLSLLPEVNEA